MTSVSEKSRIFLLLPFLRAPIITVDNDLSFLFFSLSLQEEDDT